ncbi:hypothetical protein OIU77_013954 [Salix suchowensis]|uniref:UBC core domain-containing protein n=1 Tax=Salix suchowensis TaxID=1278906 RepID=A0ABQ8ZX43_9ROSI|nr:hypothetical protein OIU77_013954 [Salix suchowensis]
MEMRLVVSAHNLANKSQNSRQQQQQTTASGEIQEIDIFHRFDVVSDSSDHHYLDIIKKETNSGSKKTKGEGDSFSNISSGAYKKIMQEWKILEKHLPDSIYVRVYENRIDLLRAVIIGAAGTPYHDGLYFFDIAFPPDFPARPPLVYYRSFGLRINPNLYANGRALVLNEKPYYNEPGNGVLPGRAIWEKKSNAYIGFGFQEKWSFCGGIFLEQLKQPVEKKTLSFKGKTVRMVFGKLKKVLGLKKKDNSGKSGVKSNGS